jgi:hypothetical protein
MNNWVQRRFFFLVVWLTMISFISVNGQNVTKKSEAGEDFSHLRMPGSLFMVQSDRTKPIPASASSIWYQDVFAIINTPGKLYEVPADIFYVQSGYFCKREWQLEKTTHIPFRIRVGSLADCNRMEGKQ